MSSQQRRPRHPAAYVAHASTSRLYRASEIEIWRERNMMVHRGSVRYLRYTRYNKLVPPLGGNTTTTKSQPVGSLAKTYACGHVLYTNTSFGSYDNLPSALLSLLTLRRIPDGAYHICNDANPHGFTRNLVIYSKTGAFFPANKRKQERRRLSN